jgi:hypothetical protein
MFGQDSSEARCKATQKQQEQHHPRVSKQQDQSFFRNLIKTCSVIATLASFAECWPVQKHLVFGF